MILRLSFLIILFVSGVANAQLMSEYTQKTGRLNNLEKRVAETKKLIIGHMKAIDASEDDAKSKQLYNEMLDLHKELKEITKEYNEVRHDLKYKFPKKNDQTQRRYLPLREQTLEDIENETGIDSILTRVKHKIDKKYEKFDDKKKNPRAHAKAPPKKKERIRLER